MTKTRSDKFIRGGQTTQHWVRMGVQVVKSTIAFAALVFAISYAILCVSYFKIENAHVSWGYAIAEFNVENRGQPQTEVRYRDPSAGWVKATSESIYLNEDFKAIKADYEYRAVLFIWYSLVPALLAAGLAVAFFFYSGGQLEGDNHVRGTQLVDRWDLKRWSDAKWKEYRKRFGKDFKTGPQYTIAGIKFPPNAVEAQTAVCGTVGTGKSNAIKELLTTVREEGGRAIVYDRMGAYVRDFYDPETDVIINPFDRRSRAWSPFLEATSPEFFTQLSEVFIPDKPGASDPFWSQAARIVFDYAAQSLFNKPNPTNAKLRAAILDIPSDELSKLIEATPGRHFFNEDISKTADSIRANLIAELRFLEFLRDDAEAFSIRSWIKTSKTGFVFLTGDAEHSAATRNIISSVFEVAANALMTCDEVNDPSVWFMMDEVPTLNRMPFLTKSLAEIRQFGGAFVVGYQVFSQLEDIYGDKGAKTIAGNLNNRIIFNTPDFDTAEIFSKSLGSEDVEERRESISVGAHETRDGVGFMSQRTERRIVTPSEIQSLPQFVGYIRFAYDSPAARVVFDAFETTPRAPKFEPYHRSKFPLGELEDIGKDPLRPDSKELLAQLTPSPEEWESYQAYRKRLTSAGIEMYAIGEADNDQMWSYYCEQRRKGRKASEIGTPRETVPLMGGAPPAPMLWLTEPMMRKDGMCLKPSRIMPGFFPDDTDVPAVPMNASSPPIAAVEPVKDETPLAKLKPAVVAHKRPPPEPEPELQLFYPDEIEGNEDGAREAHEVATQAPVAAETHSKPTNQPKTKAKKEKSLSRQTKADQSGDVATSYDALASLLVSSGDAP